ncbi:hypothetical protein HYT05_03000, partial [Candidatus Kaiserbacteria bacterium]|nr:hypothetical protein [Candidatus Kaiserbacteria bacterium]
MKISRQWLQTYFDSPLPSAEALSDALTFHAFEIDGIEQHGNDFVLDVKITANRGHDCLSVHGIAKELSAILKVPLKNDPFATKPNLTPVTNLITVSIEDPTLCPRYTACLIRGVKVGPSPQWLKDFLEAVGQRSINNVVDLTNFVMIDLGQPLHAFDYDKVKDHTIKVRKAKAGEKLITLDGKERELTEDMLVIADSKNPIGLAGIMGGAHTEVTNETKTIIVEAATFEAKNNRKTSKALNLRTDAATRFEKGLDPNLPL